jgi:DNA polymerase I-like protein with 3'-5' exonuclease and polymerase domains/uracil-DNA glycosylase
MTFNEPRCPPAGDYDAEIMLVGEAPGQEEMARLEPFVGASGAEMTRMIHQAGIIRSDCFITNVCKYRPPRNQINRWFYPKTKAPKDAVLFEGKWIDARIYEGILELEEEVNRVQPKLIIAFGNTALLALAGEYGITKWRGSGLQTRAIQGRQYPLVPTYHPAAILRNWSWRYIALHDLRKARKVFDEGLPVPEENFYIRPNADTALGLLRMLTARAASSLSEKMDIAVDLETRGGQITCLGIAWSKKDSLCIPFLEMKADNHNYWKTLEEETEIVWAIKELLTHPNVKVVGQHFTYDQQYTARRMGFVPNFKPDTFHDIMTAHHVMFAGLPKGLDFQSSFYLDDHVYWKDEGKEWNPKLHSEEQHWVYNCKDCVRTYAIAKEQRRVYAQLAFKETSYGSPWTIQHESHEDVLRAMLRGVLIDKEKKKVLQKELSETIDKLESYVDYLLGHPLNPRSPKQLNTLFYHDFKIKPVTTYDRATGNRRRTCNADALATIAKREVLLAPVCEAISDVRSLGTFKSVVAKDLDHDGRIRCAYTVPGTETYRYNSKEDAFGFGSNLQNVSSGKEKDDEGNPLDSHDQHYRPNLRRMFVPDPGHAIADHDLEQADARIVQRESGSPRLKEIFDDPSRDLHNENTEIIFGKCTGKSDPNRPKSKAGVHLTNYGGTVPVLAATLGITRAEADRFQSRYFGAYPEVKEWHDRIRLELQTRRYVENIFGYRRFYFDRIEDLLKEALAWIPQSTVAIVTNLGIQKVRKTLPWAEFLLQVHDSAVHQFPYTEENSGLLTRDPDFVIEEKFEKIRKTMEIVIPYDDPLIIPVAGSWSLESWGDCK